MICFVIGVNASGKSWFIKNYADRICPDAKRLNVFDYQKKAQEEHKGDRTTAYDVLTQANKEILDDIISIALEGENVIVEHTLFKRKRRLTYIDAIRRATNEPISVYIMWPSDERLKENVKSREDIVSFNRIKDEMDNVIELPNIAEGFDHIYFVTDGEIHEDTEAPNEQLCENARKELEEEEITRKEKEEKNEKRRKLIEELCAGKPYWHFCSGCGAKKLLTSQQAFKAGWDYPGKPGLYQTSTDYGFGTIFPRTCPSCTIDKSLYWKMFVLSKGKPYSPTVEEKLILYRIANEPFSLIDEPDDQEQSITIVIGE